MRGANCRRHQLEKLRAEQSQNLLRFSREGALERPAYQIIDFQPVTRRTMLAPYSSLTRTTKASLRDFEVLRKQEPSRRAMMEPPRPMACTVRDTERMPLQRTDRVCRLAPVRQRKWVLLRSRGSLG